jgi:cytoskeletal protein CcmA (bactofilin family)
MPDTSQARDVQRDINPRTITATGSQSHTLLGGSLTLKGELTGAEDLTIDGQFEGTLNVPDHTVTIGQQGHVKAEVHARQVIIIGSVDGKVTARDKIELRRSGNVVGDLISSSVSIEEGAYFKGSIEILRETGKQEVPRAKAASAAITSTSLTAVG